MNTEVIHANISSMDNQVKIPKSEGGGFLPNFENDSLNNTETNSENPGKIENQETAELEPLVAKFETKPELLNNTDSDDKTKKRDDKRQMIILPKPLSSLCLLSYNEPNSEAVR